MPSPFPGMNPYLEHPDFWSDFHNRLTIAIAYDLAPKLLPKYQVVTDKRVYELAGSTSLLVGRPDVTVQRERTPSRIDRPTTSSIAITSARPSIGPVRIQLPMPEEVRETYLEVRDSATQEVVTALEVLSPTNKQGEGRQKYERKRADVLRSRTHLVEIDLLRMGEPLPMLEHPDRSHYRIVVSRSEIRPIADLYPFNLPDRIPAFPLPLRADDVEPLLDLQSLLDDIYDRSGYGYFIDYHRTPQPPVSEEDAAWIDRDLRDAGLLESP